MCDQLKCENETINSAHYKCHSKCREMDLTAETVSDMKSIRFFLASVRYWNTQSIREKIQQSQPLQTPKLCLLHN